MNRRRSSAPNIVGRRNFLLSSNNEDQTTLFPQSYLSQALPGLHYSTKRENMSFTKRQHRSLRTQISTLSDQPQFCSRRAIFRNNLSFYGNVADLSTSSTSTDSSPSATAATKTPPTVLLVRRASADPASSHLAPRQKSYVDNAFGIFEEVEQIKPFNNKKSEAQEEELELIVTDHSFLQRRQSSRATLTSLQNSIRRHQRRQQPHSNNSNIFEQNHCRKKLSTKNQQLQLCDALDLATSRRHFFSPSKTQPPSEACALPSAVDEPSNLRNDEDNKDDNDEREEILRKCVDDGLLVDISQPIPKKYSETSFASSSRQQIRQVARRIFHSVASTFSSAQTLLNHLSTFVGEQEWFFLIILGITMAILSYSLDVVSESWLTWRLRLLDLLLLQKNSSASSFKNLALQLTTWTGAPLLLIFVATLICQTFSPQAIGSGVPEIKTILHGIVLKEYLTLRTLLTKYFSLMLVLCSDIPVGKVGPLVHIGAMVARQLGGWRNYLLVLPKKHKNFRSSPQHEQQQRSFSRNVQLNEVNIKHATIAAGCAVGVACCNASPVGGVLLSIEITSTYFAVENYWRGFLAAVCAALTFRLLGFWLKSWTIDILPLFQTALPIEFPFDTAELCLFMALGCLCGLLGALFVKLHRSVVLLQRACFTYLAALGRQSAKTVKKTSQNKWTKIMVYAYPLLFTLLFSLCTYPPWFGNHLLGRMGFRRASVSFFTDSHNNVASAPPPSSLTLPSSFPSGALNEPNYGVIHYSAELGVFYTTTATSASSLQQDRSSTTNNSSLMGLMNANTSHVVQRWKLKNSATNSSISAAAAASDGIDVRRHIGAHVGPTASVIFTLLNYVIFHFLFNAIALTLPIPSGVFVPTFVLGAALGRLFGETIAYCFPSGVADLDITGIVRPVLPGAYAVVGAAALVGAVTQTVSPSVIAVELTGQVAHIIPILGAVLIANSVARRVGGELSIYDSLIRLKKLPYMPQMAQSKPAAAMRMEIMKVEDIMTRTVSVIALRGTTYEGVRAVLADAPAQVSVFPLVDSTDTMVLIGTIARRDLQACLDAKLRFKNFVQQQEFLSSNKLGKPSTSTAQRRAVSAQFRQRAEMQQNFNQWQQSILQQPFDFCECAVSIAPIQVVETLSISILHKVFSLFGVHVVYATSLGRLVGVVTVGDLRRTLQKIGDKNLL